jgi:hypothetical protein
MNKETFESRNHCLKIDFDEKKKSLIYSIRSYILEKFGIWDIWDLLPYRYSLYYYDYIKPFFSPRNKRIRKAVPRQYRDISSLIIDINFEFIKAFYEDEYKADIVDWDATENHKEFAEWLVKAYRYITVERAILEQRRDDSYPMSKPLDEMFELKIDENGKKFFEFKDDGIPYEVKYKDVNLLEAEICKRDTEILIELAKRRDYFWT